MLILRFVTGILSVGLLVLGAAVSAQDFPNKPVRILTAAAGGGSDFTARLIAQGMSGLGQPVIVDNRTNILAAEAVSKSPPDGYALVLASGSMWTAPLLQKMPYDVERDFAPVSLVTREVLVLAVHPSVPVKSVRELIALAKARPGELNYAGGGIGGAPHFAGALFKTMAGINIVVVFYKGVGPALIGLMGGEMQMMFADVGSVMPLDKAGKLRALAVSSATPSTLVPGLPTVASGLPGYESVTMTGVFAPAKTPEAVVNRLNQEIVRSLNRPDVKEKFLNAGAEVVASSPAQFATALKAELTNVAKVIKEANIKIE